MDEKPENRRLTPRTELLLRVDYQESKDLLADYLTDLTDGGLFLRTSVPFEVGKTIHFSVSFPGLLAPMKLAGIVRWRRGFDASEPVAQPGVGVEFIFSEELTRKQVHDLHDQFRTKLDDKSKPPMSKLRALLVEDNQFVKDLFLFAVKKYCRELGDQAQLDVALASNGQDAWRELERAPVDLAIVDQFLPIMTGSQLILRMRQDPRFSHIPVVVISTGGDEVREEVLRAGADLYLDKPVLLKQLLATLRLLMERGGRAPEAKPQSGAV